MEKQHFIYMTTNNVNGKRYIGKHYGYSDDGYLGSGFALQRAIEKYGKEHFSREILEYNDNDDINNEREKYYIALYNATQNPLFYNIHEGGKGGNTTAGWSEERREQFKREQSERLSGEGNPRYGEHLTDEQKAYLSFYATNIRDNSVYRTNEFKEKMSAVTKGSNNGMYGKKHTEESKHKMSIHHKGKTLGEKNGMYGKSGDKAINGITVKMYDLDGNLEKEFVSKKCALDFLGLKGHTQLDNAIKNHTEYKGHYWEQEKRQDKV